MNKDTEILKSRAIEAAKRDEAAYQGRIFPIVEFSLLPEKFAINRSQIFEVIALTELTPIPGAPSHIPGVINNKGEIIAVVNLKKLLSLPEKGLTDMNKIIITGDESIKIGLIADSINGTYDVREDEISSSSHFLDEFGESIIESITKSGVIIIDAHKLITSKNLIG